MKIAFHFNADDKSFNGFYGTPIDKEVYKILLHKRNLNISSKIFVGDILLSQYSMDKKSEECEGNIKTIRFEFNKEKYSQLFYQWLNSSNYIWEKFDKNKIEIAFNSNIYVLCFDNIDIETAEFINSKLENYSAYLGGLEVNDESRIHWELYSNSLIPLGRIINKKLYMFYEDPAEDRDYPYSEEMEKIGFKEVSWECLNGRYTIFDKYHNYEQARRIAEWNKKSGLLLSFVAENIAAQLSDTAPDLTNKLWSALKTFERSETNEDYSQVASSCRKIFEYVVDSIFPPSNKVSDGHPLDKTKYKNRLFAYAEEARKSNTNIDLIVASTTTLFESWEKLNNLTNKGIHNEVVRSEARRALLRTIMLLDDIISLKTTTFEIKTELDIDDLFNNLDKMVP